MRRRSRILGRPQRRRVILLGICFSMLSSAVASASIGSSEQYFHPVANEVWRIYGLGEQVSPSNADTGPQPGGGNNAAWMEWHAMKFAWTTYGGQRNLAMDTLRRMPVNGVQARDQPCFHAEPTPPNFGRGYVWSWFNRFEACESWPVAEAYHFDQIPRYVIAIRELYMWSRDEQFLLDMLPRAEVVMDQYMLGTMRGQQGVLVIPGTSNNGTATGKASTWMDRIRSGHKEAWINAGFYTALRAMVDLETVRGNAAKAASYQALVDAFPQRYTAEFWTGSRFGLWRDANGVLHDRGFTAVNLEALDRGLGGPTPASFIFHWLDEEPAALTDWEQLDCGPRTNTTAVYANIVAPRANTQPITSDEWMNDPGAGTAPAPYGQSVQNGGTHVWSAYYDVSARLRYLGPDNAYRRFLTMARRIAGEPDRLIVTIPDPCTDLREHFDELGTHADFPEAGIAALPVLKGFIGAAAGPAGFTVTPALPQDLLSLTADGINYRGVEHEVTVSRGEVLLQHDGNDNAVELGSRQLTQQFTSNVPFNEVDVFVGTYQTSNSAFTLQLQRSEGGIWRPIVSRTFTDVVDNTWAHFGFEGQSPGTYRIVMMPASGPIAWWHDQGASTAGFGPATAGGVGIGGVYRTRIVQAPQAALIEQRSGTVGNGDEMSGGPGGFSLGQTFYAPAHFDRVSFKVGTYFTSNRGFTATLFEDTGALGWQARVRQVFRNVVDNSEVMLAFGSLPRGKYMLQLTDPVGGNIAWYRTPNHFAYIPPPGAPIGDGVGAIVNGGGHPEGGHRWFSVFQGTYRVNGIPVPAGGTVVLSP